MNNIIYAIPHLNDAEKLLRCIISINFFKKSKDRIIIIDDSSNLDQLKYIDREILNNNCDEEIIFKKNESNKGPAYCRNICINYAIEHKFSYLTFIDSDDYLIEKLDDSELSCEDIIFYDSVEILEYKKNYTFEIIKHVKDNLFLNVTVDEEINSFLLKPHKTNSLTSCWAKLYKVSVLESSKVLFNEKMRTFEDVDFLIRYLSFITTYKIIRRKVYTHTNNISYNSATFGLGNKYSYMFGFLQVSRSLKIYIMNMKKNNEFSKFHFLACYYSITLIRIASKINNYNDFIRFLIFIRRRFNSSIFKNSFKQYNAKAANGRPFIKFLVYLKYPFMLGIYLIVIGKIRYKLKR
jgi:glycosyltransferase involved in cell wall biosynthesis